ncbi:hypothetical protein BGW39_003600, partial [Mortierella sp. 14UC]
MRLNEIPEILLHISDYLAPSDLASCVQVNHDWNNILASTLWSSIDDSLFSWIRLLETYDEDDEDDKQQKPGWNEEWIRALFVKYGPHIRHLKVSWIVLLDAVSRSETCTGILSLEVGDLMSKRTRKQGWDVRWLSNSMGPEKEAYLNELREMNGNGNELVGPEELLSPIFEGAILKPKMTASRKEQRERSWTSQRFLLFLRTRATRLKRLHLSKSLESLGEIQSTELVYLILADLKELRELTIDVCSLSLDAILRRLPKVELIRSTEFAFIFDPVVDTFPDDYSVLLDGTYRNLYSLSMMCSRITVSGFACLLRCLPSLKALCIKGFTEDLEYDAEDWDENEGKWKTNFDPRGISSAMGGSAFPIPNSLEEIRLMSQFGSDSPILSALFPWLPHLRRLTVNELPSTQIHELLKNCLHFESI